MTLKYEGDKVTRVGGGDKGGNGGDTLGYLLRMFFGSEPSQWVRFVLLGVVIALLYHAAIDFRDAMLSEGQAVRRSLNEYIAANEQWQQLNQEERDRLIRKADIRFRRLYQHNGWDYQGLTE